MFIKTKIIPGAVKLPAVMEPEQIRISWSVVADICVFILYCIFKRLKCHYDAFPHNFLHNTMWNWIRIPKWSDGIRIFCIRIYRILICIQYTILTPYVILSLNEKTVIDFMPKANALNTQIRPKLYTYIIHISMDMLKLMRLMCNMLKYYYALNMMSWTSFICIKYEATYSHTTTQQFQLNLCQILFLALFRASNRLRYRFSCCLFVVCFFPLNLLCTHSNIILKCTAYTYKI